MKDENRRKLIALIIGVSSVIIFIFLWDRYASFINSPYLKGPQEVFNTLISILTQNQMDFTGYTISDHISASLFRVFSGFSLAAITAIPIGLLCGWSWYIDKAVSPLVEIIRPIPPLSWIPFAIYFFAYPLNSIFIVFLGSFFPILLITTAGVKSIDPLLIDAAKTLGAKKFDLFRKIIVPASISSIMTGLRVSIGIGWMCLAAAELVAVKGGGLGLYISEMSSVGLFANVFAGMIIIGALGFIMVWSMTYIERRLTRWVGMS